ncbi:acyl-CoA carboxylase subunit epsilon [uncultured Jatrophihabitans sp.]|uniref:acyl-CoA carboxylase subunit epsilon n=1 Tax=uncultured Jatrophihabitans sp. TaxID=1610747 RepID=UPI0035CB17F4
MSDNEQARPALLRVVGGSPTPEELAVLTALVSAAGGGDESAPRVRRGGWDDPSALHRRQLTPGPNAWRSALR